MYSLSRASGRHWEYSCVCIRALLMHSSQRSRLVTREFLHCGYDKPHPLPHGKHLQMLFSTVTRARQSKSGETISCNSMPGMRNHVCSIVFTRFLTSLCSREKKGRGGCKFICMQLQACLIKMQLNLL